MPTVYVIAVVPLSRRVQTELAVRDKLVSPGDILTVPLSATGALPATHMGCCGAVDPTGRMALALPALKAAIPGSQYATVPVETYDYTRDWLGTLTGWGLKPILPTEVV